MRKLDRTFADDAVARLDALPSDAQPAWGSLTRDGVIAHLVGAFEYSMSQHESLPPQSGIPFPGLIGRLVINGILSIPKNVRFRGKGGGVAPVIQSEKGDIEGLRAVMEEFIEGVERGNLRLGRHPAFGEFTPKQWLKFHRVHVNHHLKQFGA